jgi:hypothetical protein
MSLIGRAGVMTNAPMMRMKSDQNMGANEPPCSFLLRFLVCRVLNVQAKKAGQDRLWLFVRRTS